MEQPSETTHNTEREEKTLDRAWSSRLLTTFNGDDALVTDKNKVKIIMPDGQSYEFPLLKPSCGPCAIDVRQLYDKTGVFTYDPGFTSTASCHSDITFIDGAKGVLLHRGYSIEELAAHSDFDDVSYLLLYGDLPSPRQKLIHHKKITSHSMVHEKLIQFYKGFKSDAHPMAIMVGVVGALSAFYHDSLDITQPAHRALSAYRLIAKMPTIAAIAYKTSIGQPIIYPRNDLSYAENFLYMMFAIPTERFVIRPSFAKALECFLVLHMDHEQNASTSTVRIAGSSHANPFACIASGIAALWGPAHGGANEAVLAMLEQIGSIDRIPEFLEKAKRKDGGFRLMGFGHRVYKNYDPRATQMRTLAYEVLQDKREPLLELALALEAAALKDDYFVKRKLFPNVDFYSGIGLETVSIHMVACCIHLLSTCVVLKTIGIPVSMFTVLFAVARTVGWVAQWKEMIEDPRQKIGRPRQLYVGSELRRFTAVEERPEVIIEPEDKPIDGKRVSVIVVPDRG